MSQPNTLRRALRHDNGEIVFAEQWHAQVISVLEVLVAEGKINPEEWSQTLGAELARPGLENISDTDDRYYEAYLRALELILDKSQFATHSEVDKRESDWRKAYLSTPHGNPVMLDN